MAYLSPSFATMGIPGELPRAPALLGENLPVGISSGMPDPAGKGNGALQLGGPGIFPERGIRREGDRGAGIPRGRVH